MGIRFPTALLAAALPSHLESLSRLPSHYSTNLPATAKTTTRASFIAGGGSCPTEGPGLPPFSPEQVSLHLCWGKGFICSKQLARGGRFPHHLPRPAQPLLRSCKILTWK